MIGSTASGSRLAGKRLERWRRRAAASPLALTLTATSKDRFSLLFTALVVIQGVHVFEHIVQLLQVTVFGVPDDQALGLLGYVLALQGTEEWLHLVFNASYLVGLYALLVPLWRKSPAVVPAWALAVYLSGVALETWHIAEHVVIIWHVLANGGCPCPGITDARLNISDTYLHFFYNVAVYAAVVATYWRVRQTFVGKLRPVTP